MVYRLHSSRSGLDHIIPPAFPLRLYLMTKSRRLSVVLILVGLCFLTAVYALCDPEKSIWMPKCMFHFATGYDCPGCGSQRAIHSMLTGDFAGAFRANAFLFLIVPFFLLLAYAEFNPKRHPRLYKFIISPPTIYTLLTLIIAWAVFRNIFLR